MGKQTGGFHTLKQNTVWKFFASVRLTVVLLFVLAGASIVGTVIPQNESTKAYVDAFGVMLFKIFYVFGLLDLYYCWWFQLLMVMLALNIIVCSADRLHSTWRVIFPGTPAFKLSRFASASNKQEFTVNAAPDQLLGIYVPKVTRGFGYHSTEPDKQGFSIFAEKGRWTRLGVYAVHFSVVLLLLGGLIGSIFGFEGFVNIAEGEAASVIRLRNSNNSLPLGFEIRCNDFNVKFHESGSPEEFRSNLTIIENGSPVLTRDIIVNDPLRHRGINLFQSSYGMLPARKVGLNFQSRETGMIYPKELEVGEKVDLPWDLGTFHLKGFIENYSFMGRPLGQAFIGILEGPGRQPEEVAIPIKFTGFDKMRKGHVVVTIDQMHERYYTGLQVTRDPGVGVVYAGFVMMIIGFVVTFYMSHQRLCVHVLGSVKPGKTRVMVAGIANKNKRSMELYVERMAERLKSLGT